MENSMLVPQKKKKKSYNLIWLSIPGYIAKRIEGKT